MWKKKKKKERKKRVSKQKIKYERIWKKRNFTCENVEKSNELISPSHIILINLKVIIIYPNLS